METQLSGIWDEARASHIASLTKHEKKYVTEATSPDELMRKAGKLKERYGKHRLVVFLGKINPFLAQLRSFSRIINTLVQSHPEIAALVWGLISLFLEASLSDRHCSEEDLTCT